MMQALWARTPSDPFAPKTASPADRRVPGPGTRDRQRFCQTRTQSNFVRNWFGVLESVGGSSVTCVLRRMNIRVSVVPYVGQLIILR